MKHSSGFEALCEEARKQVTEISPQETLKRIEQGLSTVLDVREDHEVAQGLISGATHLGRGILERDIETRIPDKDHELILYCGGGYRSALAAVNLQKMGYTKVLSLAGGWRSWNNLGLPVQKP
jgi:rhodanese-related sulfurtransferase